MSTAGNTLRQSILQAVQKLSERDTADGAAARLEDLASELSGDGEQFAVLLHTLTESLVKPHFAVQPFTRRLTIKILGSIGAHFMGSSLSRRQLSRLCATVFRHVDDVDSQVREACADALAALVRAYLGLPVAHELLLASNTQDAAAGEPRVAFFLQYIFDALGSRGQSNGSQAGAALCLARTVVHVPSSELTPVLPRLCHRIEQHLTSRSCTACTELLQALANVAEVCGEDLFPHAPVTAALGCLQAKAFETRIAAADVLATFAERLGPSMAGVAPVGEWGGVGWGTRSVCPSVLSAASSRNDSARVSAVFKAVLCPAVFCGC
jgi:hypothetical protein